jgi:uncharacterized protein with PIN domain/prolyl-tRNA editing enzyme YbaK/EbsC (Cys-tRNA(Pro) deacylase)
VWGWALLRDHAAAAQKPAQLRHARLRLETLQRGGTGAAEAVAQQQTLAAEDAQPPVSRASPSAAAGFDAGAGDTLPFARFVDAGLFQGTAGGAGGAAVSAMAAVKAAMLSQVHASLAPPGVVAGAVGTAPVSAPPGAQAPAALLEAVREAIPRFVFPPEALAAFRRPAAASGAGGADAAAVAGAGQGAGPVAAARDLSTVLSKQPLPDDILLARQLAAESAAADAAALAAAGGVAGIAERGFAAGPRPRQPQVRNPARLLTDDNAYLRASVQALVASCQADRAVLFVGGDRALHGLLLQRLLEARQLVEARAAFLTLWMRWYLPPGFLQADEDQENAVSALDMEALRANPEFFRFLSHQLDSDTALAEQAVVGDLTGQYVSWVDIRAGADRQEEQGKPSCDDANENFLSEEEEANSRFWGVPVTLRPSTDWVLEMEPRDVADNRTPIFLVNDAASLLLSVILLKRAVDFNDSSSKSVDSAGHRAHAQRPGLVFSLDAEWRPRRFAPAEGVPVSPVVVQSEAAEVERDVDTTVESPTPVTPAPLRAAGTAALVAEAQSEFWPVSLLQVACDRFALVFDMLELHRLDCSLAGAGDVARQLDDGLGTLLRSAATVKAGFGLGADLVRLAVSYPKWANVVSSIRSLVDVSELVRWHVRKTLHPEPTGPRGKAGGHASAHRSAMMSRVRGLSGICEFVLGKPLDKTHQVSDWQRRPLTRAQLRYAALDALVCVHVFRELHDQHMEGIDETPVGLVFEDIQFGDQSISAATSQFPADRYAPIAGSIESITREDELVDMAGGKPWDPRSLRPTKPTCLAPKDVMGYLENVCLVDATAYLVPHIRHGQPRKPSEHKIGSAAKTAADLNVPNTYIVKSLAIILDPFERGKGPIPLMALLPGDRYLDRAAVKRYLEHCDGKSASSRSKKGSKSQQRLPLRGYVRIATPQECVDIFGFEPGSFPPFGHRQTFRTLADASLLRVLDATEEESKRTYYAGGGNPAVSIALTIEELLQWSRAELAKFTIPLPDTPRPNNLGTKEEAVEDASNIGSDRAFPILLDNKKASPESPLFFPLSRPRFLVDSMLGRLARWLRVIGIDAETDEARQYREDAAPLFFSEALLQKTTLADGLKSADPGNETANKKASTTAGSQKMSLSAIAIQEGRILLTKDKKVAERIRLTVKHDASKETSCALFFLSENDIMSQFERVTAHFDITVRPEDLMSRCSKCNGFGYAHMTADEVRATYPLGHPELPVPNVLTKVPDFWRCKACGKLYWEGPKFAPTRDRFMDAFLQS